MEYESVVMKGNRGEDHRGGVRPSRLRRHGHLEHEGRKRWACTSAGVRTFLRAAMLLPKHPIDCCHTLEPCPIKVNDQLNKQK
jgi:hypothetical protein